MSVAWVAVRPGATLTAATAAGDDERWLENPRPGRWAPDVRELWAYRELTVFLAHRDLAARYKQAAFGAAWALVQPLVGAVVITLVFGRVAQLSSDGLPYLPFAFVGFAAWSYFSASLDRVAGSLVESSALVTKIYFPRLAAPLAAALPSLVELAVALAIAGVLVGLEGLAPGPAVLTLPLWVAAATGVVLSIGIHLATLNVRYRDVNSLTGPLLQVLFFASPVAYASSLIDGGWRWLFYANPMAAVIDGFRWSLLGAPAPGRWALVSLASATALLASGLAHFARAERRFADVI